MEQGQKVATLAIAVNLVMFATKYMVAGLSGSIALKAGAFDSMSDVVASSTVFVGLVIARRKTKSFPYGLYKVENLVSVVVALVILFIGYEIIKEAIGERVVRLQNVPLAIGSLVGIVTIGYVFSRYEARVGKALNSPSLMADAKHMRADMFANGIVLAGLCSNFTRVDLDRMAAFVIVIFIAATGGKILIDGIRVLLDASLDYKTLSLAEKLILSEPQVIKIKSLMGRNSGRYKFIEADIVLKTHTLDEAKFTADRIETNIKKQINNVDRALIHFEPTQRDHLTYALPLENVEKQIISNHFGQAPYFTLITVSVKDKTAVGKKVFNNPFTHVQQGKGILVAELLNKHSIDVIITKEGFEGKGPFYVFSNAAVDNQVTAENTVKDALERMGIFYESGDLKNQLKPALASANEHDQVARSREHRADRALNK